MSKITLMSAAKFEAEPTIAFFEKEGISYEYIEIGIGSILSAQRSSEVELSSKKVIFIGSCGVFNEDLDVKLVTTNLCFWSPPSTRSCQSHLIEGIEKPIEFKNSNRFHQTMETYNVACSPSITTDSSLVPSMNKCVENLELYSIGKKIANAKSALIILGITNKVHSDGRKEWSKNFKIVAKMTANLIQKNWKAINDHFE